MKLLPLLLVSWSVLPLAAWQDVTDPPLVNWMNPLYFKLAERTASAKAPERNAVSNPLVLVAITPCRVADTRTPMSPPFGGPMLQANETRSYPIPQSACNIPSNARAFSLNFTVDMTGLAGLPYLAAWPAGEPRPATSVMNAPNPAVQYLANSAVIVAGQGGAISVFASANVHLIIDINGYYIEDSNGLPAVIVEDPLALPPTQFATPGGTVRVSPAIRTLDTDNAVTTTSGWAFRAPRSCVYQVNATVRNSLALPGFHQLSLVTQTGSAAPAPVLNQVQHTSQPGVPASIGLATLVNLNAGALLWLDYSAGSAGASIQSRIAIQCVRVMP